MIFKLGLTILHSDACAKKGCVCTEFVKNHRNIILLSSGIGTLANTKIVFISIHKNYSDYAKFIKEVKAEITEYQIVDSFLISYKGDKIPE